MAFDTFAPVTDANPLPVTGASGGSVSVTPAPATHSNAAAQTITLGGTSQVSFAANASRHYLFVLNTSDTIMYLQIGAVATSASIPLAATTGGVGGGYYEPLAPPNGSVNILCATTGKAFVAIQA